MSGVGEMVIPVYPPNFVAGGIKIDNYELVESHFTLIMWFFSVEYCFFSVLFGVLSGVLSGPF